MSPSRMTLALDTGLLELPDGPMLLVNAPGEVDVSALPADGFAAVQSFYPDYARLDARGVTVTPDVDTEAQNALIHCHRSKAATLGLIAQTLEKTAVGGVFAIDGDKTGGIESVLKELRKRFDGVESYSKAHGKLIWFTRPATLPDLKAWSKLRKVLPDGSVTMAGVFSADGIDGGSAALAKALPHLKGKVADLGAGWGYLSRELLKSEDVTELDGFEADFHAVTCAKENVPDTRATFHWTDALSQTNTGYDAVISNPPFHISRKPDPALGAAFIAKAATMLKPKGQFWMVANRNLPYEQTLEDSFRKVETISQSGGFKVIKASLPKKPRAN